MPHTFCLDSVPNIPLYSKCHLKKWIQLTKWFCCFLPCRTWFVSLCYLTVFSYIWHLVRWIDLWKIMFLHFIWLFEDVSAQANYGFLTRYNECQYKRYRNKHTALLKNAEKLYSAELLESNESITRKLGAFLQILRTIRERIKMQDKSKLLIILSLEINQPVLKISVISLWTLVVIWQSTFQRSTLSHGNTWGTAFNKLYSWNLRSAWSSHLSPQLLICNNYKN